MKDKDTSKGERNEKNSETNETFENHTTEKTEITPKKDPFPDGRPGTGKATDPNHPQSEMEQST